MSTQNDDALKAEQTDVKDKGYGSVTFDGQEFAIERRPNPLLLSELARTGSGDPEAMAVIADFFDNTLVDYRAFKKAVYSTADEVDEKALMGVLQEILEKTMGRPTE